MGIGSSSSYCYPLEMWLILQTAIARTYAHVIPGGKVRSQLVTLSTTGLHTSLRPTSSLWLCIVGLRDSPVSLLSISDGRNDLLTYLPTLSYLHPIMKKLA